MYEQYISLFVYSDPVESPSFGGLVGGFGAWQDSTDEIQSISDELRNEVETRMNSPAFIKYEAVKYQTQVVAGTNYKIRIDVGGESGVEITVYKSLPLPQSTLSLVKAEWVKRKCKAWNGVCLCFALCEKYRNNYVTCFKRHVANSRLRCVKNVNWKQVAIQNG